MDRVETAMFIERKIKKYIKDINKTLDHSTRIKYINKTISPDSFKINLIKLVIVTVSLIAICALCYYIYVVTSNTRFYLNT